MVRLTIPSVGLAAVAVVLLMSACTTQTNVTFTTNVEAAEVRLDHSPIGETPVQRRLSNGIWYDPQVVIQAEGYREIRSKLQRELKVLNAVSGIIFWPIWLMAYGPQPTQHFVLQPEEIESME
ncbi:MAG: PEGA domain-containing protein [Spirochaetaceae bacterium]|nr:MAG: PEGA domain-containing protein [Spirochaetaceae bacterium]